MEQGARLGTSRGVYRATATEPAPDEGGPTITVSLAHQGGLEKFSLRCRLGASVPRALETSGEELAQRLAPFLEKHFEQIREAALKSIRTERKLLLLNFDPESPNPFA